MAHLQTSAVALRIIGDDLDPDEITKLLGVPPTIAEKKGDRITGKNPGYRIARSGMWRLRTRDRQPESLQGQIEEILGQLTPDLAVWKNLALRYRVELFCGLFMDKGNEGLILPPKPLADLGVRGIELQLDIYGPARADMGDTGKAA